MDTTRHYPTRAGRNFDNGQIQASGYCEALDFDNFYQSLHCLCLVFGAWVATGTVIMAVRVKIYNGIVENGKSWGKVDYFHQDPTKKRRLGYRLLF